MIPPAPPPHNRHIHTPATGRGEGAKKKKKKKKGRKKKGLHEAEVLEMIFVLQIAMLLLRADENK